MKALVHHGPGRKSWDEVPDAVVVEDTDAVVRSTPPHLRHDLRR